MKKIILIAVVVAFVAGCTTGYKTMEEVPASKKPLYEATHKYMDCSLKQYMKQLESKPAVKAGAIEEGLGELADKACDACGAELEAYSGFVLEKTKDPEAARVLSENLREKTREYLVELVTDKLDD